jgi:V-type H+-transporting ATPase subunit B
MAPGANGYKVHPRIDYRTIIGVEGPLVIMENVKFPTYGEIVNVNLSDGTVRQGQILEVNKKKAIVQVFEGTTGIDNRHCHIEFTGDTLKMPISDDLMVARSMDPGSRSTRAPRCWPRISWTSTVHP